MNGNVESLVRNLIRENNHNLNLAFPAVVVGTERLGDGLIDVQPVVQYSNSFTGESTKYPVLKEIPIVVPSTKSSSFTFPVVQGDFVELIVQSVDIQKFVSGNGDAHSPDLPSYGNLSNVVAIVGFTPYQQSAFNPNNYTNDFNNQDLNIVHNKNTDNEAIISINTNGDITLKSPTKVVVESKVVEVIADSIEANSANIITQGDVEIQGKSVNEFMLKHTHIGNQGSPTSPPNT